MLGENNSMKEFMGEIESSMKNIRRGELVKGRVISVTEEEAIINIGYMSDAILPKKEVNENESVSLKDILNEDEEIFVYIVNMNDGEGNVLVSKKEADKIKGWNDLEEKFKNESTLDVTVKEAVKGGVIAYVKGIRTFIPASQLSKNYVEDIKVFVGKTLTVKVIEFDREKNKVVLSRRKIEEKEALAKKQQVLHNLKSGEKVKGIVSKLVKFGAFVDLGGVEGLIHLSDLSWKRVNNASDVVSVGDEVEVFIQEVDVEKERISLALKDVNENPKNKAAEKYSIGTVLEGTVSKTTNFGAFVELEAGVEGLVHISEISEERVTKVSDILNSGDKVKVKILDIDKDGGRISLSMKEAVEKPKVDLEKYNDNEAAGTSLADLLKDFKF